MTLTPGKYAQRLGIDIRTLQVASKRLHMPWQPGMAQVDVELMDAAWQAAYRRGAVMSPVPGQSDERDDDEDAGTLESAKLRREVAQARLAELKADALERKLIPVEEVERAWVGIAAAFDSMLDTLPAKIAAALGGDAREVTRKVRAVVQRERDGLSQRVDQEAAEAEQQAKVTELVDEPDEAEPAQAPKRRGRPPKKGAARAS
jgi:phage terminase Nu1 subunit (DNA packaging protein)